ncbi:hypothetical protein [Candidatus Arsenophonus nilaparvatae]|nr:hypothetical protein [Candidatus Arsenophonus nilaparvatae]
MENSLSVFVGVSAYYALREQTFFACSELSQITMPLIVSSFSAF